MEPCLPAWAQVVGGSNPLAPIKANLLDTARLGACSERAVVIFVDSETPKDP